MLNAMSEKKKKKLIEFKIVRSPFNETPGNSNTASPNIKIKKSSEDKKSMTKSNVDYKEEPKIKFANFGIFSTSLDGSKDHTKEEVN